MTAPLTLTAYAKLRGVSVKSVSIAVRDRRLVASVGRDERNQPTIVDVALADQEWTANTRQRADRPVVDQPRRGTPTQQSGDGNPGKPIVSAGANPTPDTTPSAGVPPFNESRDLRAAAAARREAALAGIAEIELEEKRGSVVPIAEVRAEVIERYSLVKTRLLAVPSAVGQRMPDIAVRVVAVVDELVREALEELAADG